MDINMEFSTEQNLSKSKDRKPSTFSLDGELQDHRQNFYKNGFSVLNSNNFKYSSEHSRFIDTLSGNESWFHEDPKDEGSIVLDFDHVGDESNKIKSKFVSMLFECGFAQRMAGILGQPFYLVNFMHMISPPGCPKLGWHRDTYFQNDGFQVGLVPQAFKLSVIHQDVNGNAMFECVKGSHRIDCQSRNFDRLLRILTKPWHLVFDGKRGDAVLFDTSILHCRQAGRGHTARSATIFAFTTCFDQIKNYLPRHEFEVQTFRSLAESHRLWPNDSVEKLKLSELENQ